jgi:hypothetical protein
VNWDKLREEFASGAKQEIPILISEPGPVAASVSLSSR